MIAVQPGMFDPSSDEIDTHIADAKVDVANQSVDFTVEVLIAKMRPDPVSGDQPELVIPDYQRPYMWPKGSQSRFIESLILGLPIPYIFLSRLKDGRLEVVDGSQRLRSMKSFLENQFPLDELEKLDMLNGLRFADLPKSRQRELRNHPITAIVFASPDDSIRFDVFQRINAEGMKLSDAQIRRGAYKGPFYDLVLDIAQDVRFAQMTPLGSRKDREGERAELVLRYFAYAERYLTFRHDVARFLNDFVKMKNADTALDIVALRRNFNAMLDFVDKQYPYGFRKSANSGEIPRVRFEAISVGTHLAIKSGKLDPNPSFGWLKTAKFADLTRTDASNSLPRLKARIEYVRDHLIA